LYNSSVVKLRNVVGKPVYGSDFYGRAEEIDALHDASTREHVLLLAPRRVGKTSLLHEVGKRAERDGDAIAVYVSVADATSEAGFIKKVTEAIYAHKRGKKLEPRVVRRAFGHWRAVKSVEVSGITIAPDHAVPRWQEDGNRAFDAIAKNGTPLLLLIDELPILVLALAKSDADGARVRTFLQWFRNLRQREDCDSVLRFVLAGSIGLDNVVHRHSLIETINDLRVSRLGEFEPEVAHAFLGALAEGVGVELPSAVRHAMCDVVGWLIPYHLQAIFSELAAIARKQTPTLPMLDEAVERALANRGYFAHWADRLHDAFGRPNDAVARAILDACARDPNGATASTLQALVPQTDHSRTWAWISGVLANDGYLVEHAGRWRFRSGLLRRYWVRTT
jgi:hypothetical protein